MTIIAMLKWHSKKRQWHSKYTLGPNAKGYLVNLTFSSKSPHLYKWWVCHKCIFIYFSLILQ